MSEQLNLFDMWGLPAFPAIDEAFPNNESGELEYKSAAQGFPDDFWKTYSAFANTQGGVILLGLKERKGRILIEGLDSGKIAQYQKHFWDNANNPNTISVNLLQDNDVRQINIEGKLLLGFRVPVATRTQRPVHLTRNPFENTYKRNYEGDYRCTREEVRRMLADADLTTHPDSRVLEAFTLDDIDKNSLKQYRQLFAVAKPGHAWLSLEDKDFLIKLGGYRIERMSLKEGLTLAGLLMFGKELSITDPDCAPNFFPDFREILSSDPDIRWTDRIYPDGTWEANLFQFYRRVWPRLSASLPKPFQLKKGIRQDETPAHTALREAFVNALIHADYTAPGNIVIEQRTDAYQFSNPGTLLVSLHQYYRGGISECRNTSLQKMFLMIGSAEKAGSGVNKILAGWDYAHWRHPYLKTSTQPDRIILELPKFSILPDETLASLRVKFGEEIDGLGKDELMILATCHIEGDVSNSRLQYMINRHPTDITKILQELCRDGYLLSENKNRWTTYHLNDDFGRGNPENVETSGANVETLEENVETSGANMETSGENVETSEGSTNKREQIRNLILEACQNDYKTVSELAELSDRTVKHLQNRIIPELLSAGLLQRKYPETPNHPNQAYKAALPLS
jgi:predicted HTH transcriptional regulator